MPLQDSASDTPTPIRQWLVSLMWVGAIFLFLLAAVWWFGLRGMGSDPFLPAGTESAVATVSLGKARVEILRVTYGDKAEWAEGTTQKTLLLKVRNSWEISGIHFESAWEGNRQIFFSAALQRHHLTTGRVVPSLALLLRLSHTSGAPLASSYFQSQGGQQLMELSLSSSRQSTQCTSLPVAELGEHGLKVEMEDGAGGWLPVNGPVFFMPDEGLAWALISAFPRTQSELKLRFEYQKTQGICIIKNPMQVTVLPAWTAERAPTLRWEPAVRKTADYEFRVDALGTPQGMAEGWMDPNVYLDQRGLSRAEFSIGWSLWDRMGNQLLPLRHEGKGDHYRLLPGETMARLEVQVCPTSYHAWKESEVTFVAEGEWSDITAMPVLKITEEGRKLGCQELVVSRPPTHGKSSSSTTTLPLETEIQIMINSKGGAEVWSRLQSEYETGTMSLFAETGRAIGTTVSTGHGHARLGPWHTWNCRTTWKGSPIAGMRLRLGLIKRIVPDTHEFIFQVR